MHGYLLIDKPIGPSSHSAVQRVRRTLGLGGKRGIKAGHGGTLDPFASGLLIVLLGKAPKLMPHVVGHDKRYLVGIQFGAASDTDDVDGTLTKSDAPAPSRDDAERALATIAESTEQVPPAVSALHIDGKRAYARVRNGETVVIPPRPVKIHSIDLVSWETATATGLPRAIIEVHCATGTYMRAIARDLGAAVGCPAYCDELRRTQVGEWDVADAVAPDAVSADDLRHVIELVPDLTQRVLDPAEVLEIAHGRRIADTAGPEGEQLALLATDGAFVAIAHRATGLLQPTTVFIGPDDLRVSRP